MRADGMSPPSTPTPSAQSTDNVCSRYLKTNHPSLGKKREMLGLVLGCPSPLYNPLSAPHSSLRGGFSCTLILQVEKRGGVCANELLAVDHIAPE